MRVNDNEPIGMALRRFHRLRVNSGELPKRGNLVFVPATNIRRAKRFQKRLKARMATLLAKKAGEQTAASLDEAVAEFWRRTGKP